VVSSIGYQPHQGAVLCWLPIIKLCQLTAGCPENGNIRCLNTVVIADVNPVKLKEDTIEFNADGYKVRDNAPVEDVLKKLPGVWMLMQDGNITAQGKSVTKVSVNGKDFFGGDVKNSH
jgi:hypothetical protein